MTNGNLSSNLPRAGTRLVFLGGLPGSGKTHFAKELARAGWVFYDDFQAGAAGDSKSFTASRFYADLLAHLRSGHNCIVGDIRIIHDEYRRDAAATLLRDIGQVPSEVHLFENDPAQCAQNVRNAADGRAVEPRLKTISFWTNYYSVPANAVIHPVWRPGRNA